MRRMANTPPNSMERGYLLPAGCKDLIDVLKIEGKQEAVSWGIRVRRKNEMISAPYVRVIGVDGEQELSRSTKQTTKWRKETCMNDIAESTVKAIVLVHGGF